MYSRQTTRDETPLVEVVRELREEVRALREVVGELADAAQWQNNNAEDYPALVHDRSALWMLAETKLPRLIEELSGGPPMPEIGQNVVRKQQILF